MAITLPLNKMPRMGPVCVHSFLRTLLQMSWASGEPQRQGREARLQTRPCPSRAFWFLLPPLPARAAGSRALAQGTPDRSRVDVPVRTLSRNGQLYGDTDNALRWVCQGLCSHPSPCGGTWGRGRRQATSPSGNANRSAECELVRGGRKRRAWGPTCLFPGAGSSRRSSRGDPNRRPQPSQAPGEPEGGQAVLGGRRPDSRPASPAEACPGLLPRELLFAMSTLTPSKQPQGGACAVLSKEPLGCV